MAKTKKGQEPKESSQDMERRMTHVLLQVLKLHAEKNIPLVYRDSHCIAKNQFIHQYPNGRKFLISQDQTNSKEAILRAF
jgi:broad specificity phosphatase PhoE